jgi:hypothetical protein
MPAIVEGFKKLRVAFIEKKDCINDCICHANLILSIEWRTLQRWMGRNLWKRGNRPEFWLLDHTKWCLLHGLPHAHRRRWTWCSVDVCQWLVGRDWSSFVPASRSKNIWGRSTSFRGTNEGRCLTCTLTIYMHFSLTCGEAEPKNIHLDFICSESEY